MSALGPEGTQEWRARCLAAFDAAPGCFKLNGITREQLVAELLQLDGDDLVSYAGYLSGLKIGFDLGATQRLEAAGDTGTEH